MYVHHHVCIHMSTNLPSINVGLNKAGSSTNGDFFACDVSASDLFQLWMSSKYERKEWLKYKHNADTELLIIIINVYIPLNTALLESPKTGTVAPTGNSTA